MVTICFAKFWVNGQHWKAEIARLKNGKLCAPEVLRIDEDARILDNFGIPEWFDNVDEVVKEAIDLIKNPY